MIKGSHEIGGGGQEGEEVGMIPSGGEFRNGAGNSKI